MAVSPQSDSNLSGPPGQRRGGPRRAEPGSPLGYLAGLAALAGLLASGLGHPGVGTKAGSAGVAQSASLTGQLLVARTELQDPRFIGAVVYIVHHDAEGTMGLILNRPIGEASLSELLDRLGVDGQGINGEIRVHFGGPVEPPRGFVLHTADYHIEGTQVVKDGIAVTARPEILRAIGTGTGPRKSLFALGYAGWASGQLEAELKARAWELVPADEALVFDEHDETKWERALARRTIQL
jgi:putative transcriptional regulator